MAKYNVHAGHCPQGKGASGTVGFLKESVEDRIVKNEMIRLLKAEGHTAYDCTCDVTTTKSGCLAKIVAKCNAHAVDADASIHLNSGRNDSKGDGDTGGVEVFVYSKSSKVYDMAERICKEISKELGIRNRGVKIKTNLYVLRNTKAPAFLVECCFVDDKDDFEKWDAKRCAKAIVKGMLNKDIKGGSGSSSGTSSGNKTTSTSSTPSYKVGNTYTLQSNMVVRTGAGTNYRAKKHSELTTDGKKHDKDKNGCLDKGTKITCKQVKKIGSDIWIKCPSGWIAAYYKKKVYVK